MSDNLRRILTLGGTSFIGRPYWGAVIDTTGCLPGHVGQATDVLGRGESPLTGGFTPEREAAVLAAAVWVTRA